MDTAREVSARALRILTYTILIKAVLDAVALVCNMSVHLALLTNLPVISATDTIYMLTRAAMFINIVACIMCIDGITLLSDRFSAVYRIMVAVLISECVTLLLLVVGISLAAGNYMTAAAVTKYIMLALVAAEKLLIGAAFLFLMKGFGGALKDAGDNGSNAIFTQIGAIYLYCSIINLVLPALTPLTGGVVTLAIATVFGLAEVALEILMYLKVSDAAFHIWRYRTSVLPGGIAQNNESFSTLRRNNI